MNSFRQGRARHPLKRILGFCRPIYSLVSGFFTLTILLNGKVYNTDPDSRAASAMSLPHTEVIQETPIAGPIVPFLYRRHANIPRVGGEPPNPQGDGGMESGYTKKPSNSLPLADTIARNLQRCRYSQVSSNIRRTAFRYRGRNIVFPAHWYASLCAGLSLCWKFNIRFLLRQVQSPLNLGRYGTNT